MTTTDFVDRWCKLRTKPGKQEMLRELESIIQIEVDRIVFDLGENLEDYDDDSK